MTLWNGSDEDDQLGEWDDASEAQRAWFRFLVRLPLSFEQLARMLRSFRTLQDRSAPKSPGG